LLDDPLAAVDAHVGKDLFNKCIVDEMLLGKSKGLKNGERAATVILVTNALQYLSHEMVDKIIVLGDGRVEEMGTFAGLSSDPNSRFSTFLKVLSETSAGTIDTSDGAEDDEDDIDDVSAANIDLGSESELSKFIPSSPQRSTSLTDDTVNSLTDDSSLTDDNSSSLSCTTFDRKMSVHSVDGSVLGEEDDEKKGALMTDELKEREKGSVDRLVYIAWSKAAGGVSESITILSMFVGLEIMQVISKWWLTHWSQSGGDQVVFYLGMYAVINFR
jgi:ATP-binding cassette subfamily C (CFTR/MRP) protein 1